MGQSIPLPIYRARLANLIEKGAELSLPLLFSSQLFFSNKIRDSDRLLIYAISIIWSQKLGSVAQLVRAGDS